MVKFYNYGNGIELIWFYWFEWRFRLICGIGNENFSKKTNKKLPKVFGSFLFWRRRRDSPTSLPLVARTRPLRPFTERSQFGIHRNGLFESHHHKRINGNHTIQHDFRLFGGDGEIRTRGRECANWFRVLLITRWIVKNSKKHFRKIKYKNSPKPHKQRVFKPSTL